MATNALQTRASFSQQGPPSPTEVGRPSVCTAMAGTRIDRLPRERQGPWVTFQPTCYVARGYCPRPRGVYPQHIQVLGQRSLIGHTWDFRQRSLLAASAAAMRIASGRRGNSFARRVADGRACEDGSTIAGQGSLSRLAAIGTSSRGLVLLRGCIPLTPSLGSPCCHPAVFG
ncbi:hypothetical protein BD310DRAFT_151742 [Dichomitus squalens]|uniref:Uncharacterized protein n=1 Tax=Dichomitus squalens TaxID=114155 RepID=A0A4Q9Q3Y1_9APHY|nr:hypothetical protein BD310DRAFT_151742 [Dichomitus squalens]